VTIIKAQQAEELFALLLEQINRDLNADENVILVVPAQASLLVERGVFDALGKKGFFKLRIIRGQKLHEEILHECGYPGLVAINTIGRSMLLRKIASDCRQQLSAFSGVYSDSGFIDMAGDFIVQLKQNNVDDKQLDALIDSAQDGSLLKKKLMDMRIITRGYRQAMEGRFTDSEDFLDYVTSRVKDCALVRNSKIYYYGFYSFTKREYAYLSELERCSRGLSVALLSGSGANFEITRKTESRLLEYMPGAVICGKKAGRLLENTAGNIRLVRCANPFSQAKTIAADIRRLIREKGVKYSDIAVLSANSSQMTGAIERVFASLGIPFFEDEKRSILHTGAADSVIALLDIAIGNFETRDVIRLLKNGIFDFERDDIELFEIYAKQYHIKASRFLEPLRYGRDKYDDFEKLDTMRKTIAEKLQVFTNAIAACSTVKEKAVCLYKYLEDDLHFSEKLDAIALAQAEEGFTDAAEESARVWDSIASILDQFTELMGSETLSLEEFADILKTSFADVKVGVLPQADGRVLLGDIMRSFTDDKRAVYVAGFNNGLIPSDNSGMGILSDEELLAAAQNGTVLAKTSDAYADEENYMICKSLAGAKEYLWLGYCISDANGSDIKASSMLDDIKNVYPDITEENDISAMSDVTMYLEGKDLAVPEMALALREAMGGKELPSIWKEVYNDVKDESDALKEALRFTNKKQPLGKALSKELFAKDGDYSFSPSRMDGFAACPFKHFVDYGLNPDVPREFGMGGSEVGSVYHETLMRLCQKVEDWKNLDDNKLEAIIDDILKELSATKLDGVMLSGKAEIYTSKRIRQVCLRFAKHMAAQIKDSKIEKMYLEAGFGRNGIFPPITINTSAGTVYIEGRIDRVDICPDEDGKYVRVIDYKSGNVKFNKALIQKGLSLQLMVYLGGATGKYRNPAKSGVYYFCIKDPKVTASIQDLPADEIAEDVLAKIDKEYKLDGMDVDAEFTAKFSDTLGKLCERMTLGDISVEPKQIGSSYDSCEYCEFSSICLKDIE